MIIHAKVKSRCMSCATEIKIGSKIDWTKGVGARHVECKPIPNCPLCGKLHNPLRTPSFWNQCHNYGDYDDGYDIFHDY